jgi:RimJ/RimL family protein N-acetyltransferase
MQDTDNMIEIKTERLFIKPLGTEYLDEVNEYALNVENTKFMRFLPYDDTEETLSFLKEVDEEWAKEEPRFFEFAILLHDGTFVGSISIYYEDGPWELGWIIYKRYWGKGYAFEAARALLDCFMERGCKHFIAHCDAENIPSYRLMEKLGMKKTGEHGGRKNRASLHESFEYTYELIIP